MNLNPFNIRSFLSPYGINLTFPGVRAVGTGVGLLSAYSSLIRSNQRCCIRPCLGCFASLLSSSRGIKATATMIGCSLTPVALRDAYNHHVKLNPLNSRKKAHSGCPRCLRHANFFAKRSHTQTSRMKSSTCYISLVTTLQKHNSLNISTASVIG